MTLKLFIYVTAMLCTLLGLTECQFNFRGIDETNIAEKARAISCKKHDCSKFNCSSKRGWHLLGSDLGCCSHYDGCCEFASVICWVHDIMCRCCDYGFILCGPFCKKDPDCKERDLEDWMMSDGSGDV